MKKSKILFVLATLAITSCGGKPADNSTTNGSNGSGTSENHDGEYATRVVYPNGNPIEGVRVRYCYGEQCARPISTNSNGYAYFAPENDNGEYDVHLLLGDLQDSYTYNPNIYSVSTSNKEVTIALNDLLSPEKGDGTKYEDGTNNGPFIVKEGAYRISLETNELKYTSFVPTRPGVYSIESWIENGSLPEIDPFVTFFGNSPFLTNCNQGSDDIGENDKNFKFEFEVADDFFECETEVNGEGYVVPKLDENGHIIFIVDANGNYIPKSRYSFQLGAKQAATYDYAIKYVRDYVDPNASIEEVPVTATLSTYNDCSYQLVDCDIDGTSIVKSNTDGLYHLENTNGPVVVANIKSCTNYVLSSLYDLIGGPGESSLIVDNGTKSYKNFVNTYASYCNSDGVYPLNDELITFFRKYAEANQYFDGDNGFISSYFNYSGDFYDVLWCCSYYVVDGTIDNPRNIDFDGNEYITSTVEANESIYYSFGSRSAIGEVTFTPDENTILSYENTDYSSSNPLIIDVEAMSYYSFVAKEVNGHAGTIGFTFELPDAGNVIVNGLNSVIASYVGEEYTFINTGLETQTYRLTTYDDNAYIDFFDGSALTGGTDNHYKDITLEPEESLSINICCNDPEYNIVKFYFAPLATRFDDYSGFIEASTYIFVPEVDGEYAFYADSITYIETTVNGNIEECDSVDNGYIRKNLNANDEVIVLVYSNDYSNDSSLCLSFASLILQKGSTDLVVPSAGLNVCYIADEAESVTISSNDSCYFAIYTNDANFAGYYGSLEETTSYADSLEEGEIVNLIIYSYDFSATSTNCSITIA